VVRHLGAARIGDTIKGLGKVRSLYEKKGREYRAEVNLDPAHGHGSVEQKPRRALDEEDLLCPPDRIFENRRRTLGSLAPCSWLRSRRVLAVRSSTINREEPSPE
jgi:hypothetical protein